MELDLNKELHDALQTIINEGIVNITLSNLRDKQFEYQKINIMLIDEDPQYYQIASHTQTQVFHRNVDVDDIFKELAADISHYRQIDGKLLNHDVNMRISKRNKVFLKLQPVDNTHISYQHNREKEYLLDYKNIPVLKELGIVSADNQLIASQYDKFRQINKFVELIDDLIKEDDLTSLNVVDFGCGRSYLTFVLYHYLSKQLNIDVNIVGLDLKEDVIKEFNLLCDKYNYEHLNFIYGDIADYKTSESIDMVISLHACDIATDYALNQAIEWKAKYIFSVPCCQNEVYQQIESKQFNSLLKNGIVKDRLAALITDSLRANVLEYSGYQTQIIEYIDSDHSLKNLMIRAKYTGKENVQSKKEIEHIINEFKIQQSLVTLRGIADD